MKTVCVIAGLCFACAFGAHSAETDAGLSPEAFRTPPTATRPWGLWFWMSRNISKEAITADMEAYARAGFGGLTVQSVKLPMPEGQVTFDSEAWHAMFQHAVREGARLGLEIGMPVSPSWSGAGGKWIKPDDAMQQLIWSDTLVEGGKTVEVTLPPPRTIMEYYRDVTVLALPAAAEDRGPVKVTGSAPGYDGAALVDGRTDVAPPLPAAAQDGTARFLQFDFGQPRLVRAVQFIYAKEPPFLRVKPEMMTGEWQSSDDGKTFRSLRLAHLHWRYSGVHHKEGSAVCAMTVALPETKARFLRFVLPPALTGDLAEIIFSAFARADYAEAKAGYAYQREHGEETWLFDQFARELPPSVESTGAVARDKVITLAGKMDAQGRLRWDAPAGLWRVVRIGFTLTGAHTAPATPADMGLECDKLSVRGARAVFDGFAKRLLDEAGPLTGKTLTQFHTDSWEFGIQNWTADFPEQFRQRRGYDIGPWLPAICGGHVLGSALETERFLEDFRRTISEMIAENFHGELRRLFAERGVRYEAEACGRQQTAYDPLRYFREADVPMGEVWIGEDGPRVDCKGAAASAHLNGNKIVAVEAFSSGEEGARFALGPRDVKALGDWTLCDGVTRIVFTAPLQLFDDPRRILSFGNYCLQVSRKMPWLEAGRGWFDYFGRCGFLLQRGAFIGDALYCQPEATPNAFRPRAELRPAIPDDYDYDFCEARDVITKLAARDGRLVTPDSGEYRLLILPETTSISPALLGKALELARAGAIIVAQSRPVRAPGLGSAGDDAEVLRLAGELWGDCDGVRVKEHTVGNGRLVWGRTLAEVFAQQQTPPDFSANAPAGVAVRCIHRRTGGAEIYFVANGSEQPLELDCAFRVTGKPAELWNPDTGRVAPQRSVAGKDGRTIVPLKLAPAGSVFVVFRAGAAGATPTELVATGQPQTLAGSWRVSFPAGWGAPESVTLDRLDSLSKHPTPGVKYFGGTAIYETKFNAPAGLGEAGRKFFLNLGDVHEVATVELNGQPFGGLWTPPFEVEVTSALRAGENILRVTVATALINRFIGDALQSDDVPRNPAGHMTGVKWPDWLENNLPRPSRERVLFSTWNPVGKKNTPLEPSGLLGPVILQATKEIATKP